MPSGRARAQGPRPKSKPSPLAHRLCVTISARFGCCMGCSIRPFVHARVLLGSAAAKAGPWTGRAASRTRRLLWLPLECGACCKTPVARIGQRHRTRERHAHRRSPLRALGNQGMTLPHRLPWPPARAACESPPPRVAWNACQGPTTLARRPSHSSAAEHSHSRVSPSRHGGDCPLHSPLGQPRARGSPGRGGAPLCLGGSRRKADECCRGPGPGQPAPRVCVRQGEGVVCKCPALAPGKCQRGGAAALHFGCATCGRASTSPRPAGVTDSRAVRPPLAPGRRATAPTATRLSRSWGT